VLEVDVIVAGGVTPAYMRNALELWDRLLVEFVGYLREYSRTAVGDEQDQASTADQADATSTQVETADEFLGEEV